MLTFQEIQDLIKLVQKSNLSEFKLAQGEFNLVIRTGKKDKGEVGLPSMPMTMMPQVSVAPAPVQTANTAPVPAAASPGPSATTAEPAGKYLEIRSPMVGTFYRSNSPDKPAYVQTGDSIKKGTVVCIVEAMKLFNEIESEVEGKIVKICVNDATPVEFDQLLYLIDPAG